MREASLLKLSKIMKHQYFSLTFCAFALATFAAFVPDMALARRGLGFVPPPYLTRLYCSFFTIAPIAAIFSFVSYFSFSRLGAESSKKRLHVFLIIVGILVFVGSFAAANDACNDEGWNPYMSGADPLSLIVSVAVILWVQNVEMWARYIIAIVAVIPSWWLSALSLMAWQSFGQKIGLPTTWQEHSLNNSGRSRVRIDTLRFTTPHARQALPYRARSRRLRPWPS